MDVEPRETGTAVRALADHLENEMELLEVEMNQLRDTLRQMVEDEKELLALKQLIEGDSPILCSSDTRVSKGRRR
ncbi:hypothetical protein DPX39_000033900 [Trypanosoma brucei equiperdum]|uniref:Uncharacterized protein n=1 Tax=Trypanosoma brucei equiperdum TaxID=630700 RepID=A0A3L6KTW2_9TRYP|nr:hypothetical protein DPX39_000033900 [Trypanosoma brucei equiperdum]